MIVGAEGVTERCSRARQALDGEGKSERRLRKDLSFLLTLDFNSTKDWNLLDQTG